MNLAERERVAWWGGPQGTRKTADTAHAWHYWSPQHSGYAAEMANSGPRWKEDVKGVKLLTVHTLHMWQVHKGTVSV